MDRREFLRSTGAAAAAATTVAAETAAAAQPSLAAAAVASGVKELRLALPWPDGVAGPAQRNCG